MDISYVSFVGDNVFVENVTNTEHKKVFIELNGRKDNDIPLRWNIPVPDINQQARVFSILRNLGIPFSVGRDWSPEAQFEELREKGLLSGNRGRP
jgi:hypothetical protein